jgi:hypothetical protein
MLPVAAESQKIGTMIDVITIGGAHLAIVPDYCADALLISQRGDFKVVYRGGFQDEFVYQASGMNGDGVVLRLTCRKSEVVSRFSIVVLFDRHFFTTAQSSLCRRIFGFPSVCKVHLELQLPQDILVVQQKPRSKVAETTMDHKVGVGVEEQGKFWVAMSAQVD